MALCVMPELPKEIYMEIFSHLPARHLRCVSLTCRTFASLSKPLRFGTLHFHGDAQLDRYYSESGQMNVKYPGRSKTVEIGTLRATVDEVIALDIARFVKKLIFSPKYYEEGFWSTYRTWVEEQIDEDLDFERMYEEDDFRDDVEFGYAGMRRMDEERRARSEKERDLVEAAETIWAVKVQEQNSNADTNMAGLNRFFENTSNLKGIEIRQWSVKISDYGIEADYDENVGEQFNGYETTWNHLGMLSSVMQASGRRIAHLILPKIKPDFETVDSSLESFFGALTTLSFDTEDTDFMLKDREHMSALTGLIGCTSQTLQKLEFGNRALHLPSMGEHFLEALFGTTDIDAPTGTEMIPLIFPNLKEFRLGGIILNTPSLLAFLSSQPALQYACFEHVYLATIGYKWSDVAQAMPPSCTSIYIAHCGHEICRPDAPVAYNCIRALKPYQEPFPPSAGWRTSEAFFEEDMRKDLKRQADCFGGLMPAEFKYRGKSREEWTKMMRTAQYAEYERT